MKKYIITGICVACFIIGIVALFGTASCQRSMKDIKSDFTNGINRTITVYTADGDVIGEYKGKIDIESDGDGEVKFEYKGKRYIYYNCFVETIEQ